jgi:uncharacterized membrane protein
MNVILLLRFLHIFSAALFIGGIFARQLVRAYASRTNDVRQFASLSQAAGTIETRMVIPGNLAVIVFGVVLAVAVGAPLFGFLQGAAGNWLLVSNLLLVLGLLAVPLVFVPKGRVFDQALKESLLEGQMTPRLQAAIHDPTVRVVHGLEMILVLVVAALMVFKPF